MKLRLTLVYSLMALTVFAINKPDTALVNSRNTGETTIVKNFNHELKTKTEEKNKSEIKPKWVWAKSYFHNSWIHINDIAKDSSNNIYITGYWEADTLEGNEQLYLNKGREDVFITKIDPSGNIIWVKSYGSQDGDKGIGIAVDKNNNIFLSGFFRSKSIKFDAFTLDNSGRYADCFLLKMDPNGTVLWVQSANGESEDQARNIELDSLGNVVVEIYTKNGIILGAKSLVPGNYFAKYDSNGTFIDVEEHKNEVKPLKNHNKIAYEKAKRDGGKGNNSVFSIVSDKNGYLYSLGRFYNDTIRFGEFTLIKSCKESFESDIFIVKYDELGKAIWAESIKGKATDYKLLYDDNNHVFVIGDYLQFISKDYGEKTLQFGNIVMPLKRHSGLFISKLKTSDN